MNRRRFLGKLIAGVSVLAAPTLPIPAPAPLVKAMERKERVLPWFLAEPNYTSLFAAAEEIGREFAMKREREIMRIFLGEAK